MYKPAIGGAFAGVVGVLLVTRLLAGPGGLPHVRVVTDAEPIRCTGTEIQLVADDADDEQSPVYERITLLPELECKIRFWVANDGDSEVTVDRVTMPFTGISSGSGLRATNLTPWRHGSVTSFGPKPLDDSFGYEVNDRDVGTTWTVQDHLPSEDRLYYEVWVEFNPEACQVSGGELSFDGPTVYLDGHDTPIASTAPKISVAGTQFSECTS